MTDDRDRIIYFDYLRVVAVFFVILVHLSGQNWYKSDVNGYDWFVFNCYDSISRWGVPVYVMISGALFLSKEVSLEKIFKKYIFRMLTAYFFWSVIYSALVKGSVVKRLSAIVKGHYHMWFILMIIGLYLCIPVIKPIVESENRMRYYLILSFIFAFALPEVCTILKDFGSENVVKASKAIEEVIVDMHMDIVLGYAFYYVLGLYLSKTDLTRRQRLIVYFFGMIGFVSTIALGYAMGIKTKQPSGNYNNNFTINVMLEAVSIFVWFKYQRFENENINKFIRKLSKYSFGAYLVHALLLNQINSRLGFNTLSFNPLLAELCIAIIAFVLSFAISALLNRIPILNRYIV